MNDEECEHCGQSTDGLVQQVALESLKRIDALEAENAKLRAALEAAASAFNEIATVRKAAMEEAIRTDPTTALVRVIKIKIIVVDAMRACWTALGQWPPKGVE